MWHWALKVRRHESLLRAPPRIKLTKYAWQAAEWRTPECTQTCTARLSSALKLITCIALVHFTLCLYVYVCILICLHMSQFTSYQTIKSQDTFLCASPVNHYHTHTHHFTSSVFILFNSIYSISIHHLEPCLRLRFSSHSLVQRDEFHCQQMLQCCCAYDK